MRFFLPSRYRRFSYLSGQSEEQTKTGEELGAHSATLDFAFFRIRAGVTYDEYRNSTRAELVLIAYEWEQSRIFENTITRNAIINAIANTHRKRGARFIDLWKPVQQKATAEEIESGRALVAEMMEFFS